MKQIITNKQEWDVLIKFNKGDCPRSQYDIHAHIDRCTLLPNDNDECTYESCPCKILKTCKDCRYLYFNQNPIEPIKFDLISLCGMRKDNSGNMKKIHTSKKLEDEHYKKPDWCPKDWNISNIETFEIVEN